MNCRLCCSPLLFRRELTCGKCSEALRLARDDVQIAKARSMLSMAVSMGRMPAARTFLCVDCSAPAHSYDHRRYLDPLAVDPVCRKCNIKRGMAIDYKEAFVARRGL